MKEIIMESTSFTNTVERNKAASMLCKRLFPEWCKPPFQGEVQRIIILGWSKKLDDDSIKNACLWWMWARDLMITNTFSNSEREVMIKGAVKAAAGAFPIQFVTARSPELLHAQVLGQGDASLPRSKLALGKFIEICKKSAKFLPTKGTVLLADLAIDNIEKIEKACDVEQTVLLNIEKLQEIAEQLGLSSLEILRMSSLPFNNGFLKDAVDKSGKPKINVKLTPSAVKRIEIAVKESTASHQRMFGWDEEQSRTHNFNLGITMGLVGQAVKGINPNAILIHNESFIARAQLNNIFNPTEDPLPVVALRDLLERKGDKS